MSRPMKIPAWEVQPGDHLQNLINGVYPFNEVKRVEPSTDGMTVEILCGDGNRSVVPTGKTVTVIR